MYYHAGRHIFSRNSLLAAIIFLLLGNQAASHESTNSQNAISPEIALQKLAEGNKRYVNNTSKNRDFSIDRIARANAQHPIAAVLSCSDSRIVPEIAFDQGLGDLFLVRVAGNFVNEDGLASIEYAAEMLNVPLIVVLGHTNCGAVNAAIKVTKENTQLPGHLPQLVSTIAPAVRIAQNTIDKRSTQTSEEDLLKQTTIENVRSNVKRLTNAHPLLSQRVQKGKIKVVGAVYEIKTGKVHFL